MIQNIILIAWILSGLIGFYLLDVSLKYDEMDRLKDIETYGHAFGWLTVFLGSIIVGPAMITAMILILVCDSGKITFFNKKLPWVDKCDD